MRLVPLLRRFLLLAIIVVSSWATGDGGDTTTLNKDSFDEFIRQQKQQQRAVLVMFHVSWCKACQRTFPIFSAASDAVLSSEVPMAFAHVECTDDKTLCQRFQVQGYPTIKLFFADETRPAQNFRGHRSVEGFFRYAQRMTSPAVQRMSREELETAMVGESYSALLVSERYAEEFATVALHWMDRHLIAMAPNLKELLPEELHSQDASIAVYSPAKLQWGGRDATAHPAVSFYRGSLEEESAVQDWISSHRFPGIWALGEMNFYEFTHSNQSAVLLAVDSISVALETEIRQAAKDQELSEHFFFGAMNGTHWSEELKHFNILPGELPRVLISEKNFDFFIEDIEQLRATSLREDLRKLVGGAPLLRQSRTMTSKIFFYKRETSRMLEWAIDNIEKPEAIATIIGSIGILSIVLLGLVLIIMSIRSGFSEDEHASQSTKKQQ